jgi:hypothetical protein
VAKSSPICRQGAVVEIKRKIVGGKEGKKGAGGRVATLGLHLTPTFILHHILLLSCSLHLPKASKAKQIPFIFFQSSIYFFLKILDFMIYNDAINKYTVGKE